eukprot:1598722-Prorocentrum_lima.AAC.1
MEAVNQELGRVQQQVSAEVDANDIDTLLAGTDPETRKRFSLIGTTPEAAQARRKQQQHHDGAGRAGDYLRSLPTTTALVISDH